MSGLRHHTLSSSPPDRFRCSRLASSVRIRARISDQPPLPLELDGDQRSRSRSSASTRLTHSIACSCVAGVMPRRALFQHSRSMR